MLNLFQRRFAEFAISSGRFFPTIDNHRFYDSTTWNSQGIVINNETQQALVDMIRCHWTRVLSLSETIVTKSHYVTLRHNQSFDGCLGVHRNDEGHGLAMLWMNSSCLTI